MKCAIHKNPKSINIILALIFLLISLADIFLTYHGVRNGYFLEGNPLFKDSVETLNLVPNILFRGFFFSSLFLGIVKMKRFHLIASFAILMGIMRISFVVIKELNLIGFWL